MKTDVLTDYYRPLLEQNHFLPIPCPEKFSPAGQCWEIATAVGGGYYWVYAKQDLFDIKIHDFYFHEDQCLDMAIPECISIQRYDSISGEELDPYRRLSAGDIIPGDVRFLAAKDAFLSQAALTGESLPREVKEQDEVLSGYPRVRNGYIEPTDQPGIGVTIHEEEARGDKNFLWMFEEGWEKREGNS